MSSLQKRGSPRVAHKEDEQLINSSNNNNNNSMDEESRGTFVPLDVGSPTSTAGGSNINVNSPTSTSNVTNAITNSKKKNGLRAQLHSFKVMSMPYFQENRQGRILFAIMVILTLANSAVRVFFSYLARDFWSALSDKNVDEFYSIMTQFVGSM